MSSPAAGPGSEASALLPQSDRYIRRLIAWWAFLVAVSIGFWLSDVDPGIAYAEQHIAAVLAILGLAIWLVRRSGLSRPVSWGVSASMCLLVAAFYLNLLPVEMINNGDTGIVGIRWR